MKWTIFLQDQLQLIKTAFALPKNIFVLEPITNLNISFPKAKTEKPEKGKKKCENSVLSVVAKPGSLSGSAKSLVLDPDLNINKCWSELLVCEDKLKYSIVFTFIGRKVNQK
jgi:hypothetical protein